MPKETFARLRTEKQDRVMRAAVAAFNKNGFERTTVDEIAAGAGIAKGSIYQYFADKKELFLYCAEWGLAAFMKKLDAYTHVEEMDVFEYFHERVGKAEVLEEEQDLALFMQQIAREPALASESMQKMYTVADDYIYKLLRNSVRKRLVRDDIDEELLKVFFDGVTLAFKQRWMERYLDFSKKPCPEQERAMAAELEQMLTLLKTGMGC